MAASLVSDRDLATLLDEQLEAMRAVLVTLESERDALRTRDAGALNAAVARKRESIAAADDLDTRRQRALERLGLSDRPKAAGRAFQGDRGLAQRWQQLLSMTQQCRAMNEANGALINGQRRRIEATLRLVRGEAPTGSEYGADGGERRARSSQRPIASA